jgi:hypothetical protein
MKELKHKREEQNENATMVPWYIVKKKQIKIIKNYVLCALKKKTSKVRTKTSHSTRKVE